MLIKVHFFIQTISKKKTLSDLEAIKTKDMDEVEDYGQEVDGEDNNESEAEEEDREEDNSQEGMGS